MRAKSLIPLAVALGMSSQCRTTSRRELAPEKTTAAPPSSESGAPRFEPRDLLIPDGLSLASPVAQVDKIAVAQIVSESAQRLILFEIVPREMGVDRDPEYAHYEISFGGEVFASGDVVDFFRQVPVPATTPSGVAISGPVQLTAQMCYTAQRLPASVPACGPRKSETLENVSAGEGYDPQAPEHQLAAVRQQIRNELASLLPQARSYLSWFDQTYPQQSDWSEASESQKRLMVFARHLTQHHVLLADTVSSHAYVTLGGLVGQDLKVAAPAASGLQLAGGSGAAFDPIDYVTVGASPYSSQSSASGPIFQEPAVVVAIEQVDGKQVVRVQGIQTAADCYTFELQRKAEAKAKQEPLGEIAWSNEGFYCYETVADDKVVADDGYRYLRVHKEVSTNESIAGLTLLASGIVLGVVTTGVYFGYRHKKVKLAEKFSGINGPLISTAERVVKIKIFSRSSDGVGNGDAVEVDFSKGFPTSGRRADKASSALEMLGLSTGELYKVTTLQENGLTVKTLDFETQVVTITTEPSTLKPWALAGAFGTLAIIGAGAALLGVGIEKSKNQSVGLTATPGDVFWRAIHQLGRRLAPLHRRFLELDEAIAGPLAPEA